MRDFLVIGGGIVGLATAKQLSARFPDRSVTLLEKEKDICLHQSGRNSGVIHSGIYYKPGSLKAKLCREGNASMINFCRANGIPHNVCGKLIVASEESELPRLSALFERGIANGLDVQRLNAEQLRELEPNVAGVAGIRLGSTAIVDFRKVAERLASDLRLAGGEIKTSARVTAIQRRNSSYVVSTDSGEHEASFIINCAGLYSDHVARMGNVDPQIQIVPFRGEYYELKPERRHLVNGLIYPVPNPELPFLGVHYTRMIDDSVHLGPNAVLAFAREGYARKDVRITELIETLTFPGFWRLIASHLRNGASEMVRSMSKTIFVKQLQRLVPAIAEKDVVPSTSGVRAQAVTRDGKMVDDFFIMKSHNAVHVCNAPSPAATASLEIARHIVDQIPQTI